MATIQRTYNLADDVGVCNTEYMNTKEAAEKWGVSVRRVQEICRRGELLGVKRQGNAWAIPKYYTQPLKDISNKKSERGLFKQLQEQLSQCKNERELAPFLKKHLLLIRNTLNVHAWNCVVCQPEFRLGTEYIADFLILSADSGCWHAVFIEMQSHQDSIYNKDGSMTRQLNEAQKQIQEWKIWIEEHPMEFRKSVSRLVDNCAAQCSRADVHVNAGAEIRDIKTVVWPEFKILIGRRSYLNQESNKRRATSGDFEIVTFDRLLDVAKRLDMSKQNL